MCLLHVAGSHGTRDGWMMVVEKRIHHQPLIRSSRILLVQIIWAAQADETAPN